MTRHVKNVPAELGIYDNTTMRQIGNDFYTQDNVVFDFTINSESVKNKKKVVSYGRDWGKIDPNKTPRAGLTQCLKYAASNYKTTFKGLNKINRKHEGFISNYALKSVKAKFQTSFWCDSYHSVLLDSKTNIPIGFMTVWQNPESGKWNTFISQDVETNAKHAFFEHDITRLNFKCPSKVGKTMKFADAEYNLMIRKLGMEN